MISVLESLNTGLRACLRQNPDVVLLGEDLLDPYGGAFKVTRGLSTDFPEQVITTPISEAGFSGAAVGMALRGMRPVVEIMFGDFLTLAMDALVNSAAKYPWMFNGQVSVPLTLRTPMGGYRGYGPTHSQSLEKMLLGTPGLRVLAPTHLGDPEALIRDCVLHNDQPTLFVEHKLLYGLPVYESWKPGEFELTVSGNPETPHYALRISGAPAPAVTMAAYGYMAEFAVRAMRTLAYEHEVFCELQTPTLLSPAGTVAILESVGRTRRLLTIEEASTPFGWGAEVVANIAEQRQTAGWKLSRLGAADAPIPAAKSLEDQTLPQVEQIVQRALEMVR